MDSCVFKRRRRRSRWILLTGTLASLREAANSIFSKNSVVTGGADLRLLSVRSVAALLASSSSGVAGVGLVGGKAAAGNTIVEAVNPRVFA